ncbi:MAG: hypothetical protein MZV70_14215, partial [Desulfobacterales bacterium]|nr:hypothetical protein [Desulfobacterales bacterium]
KLRIAKVKRADYKRNRQHLRIQARISHPVPLGRHLAGVDVIANLLLERVEKRGNDALLVGCVHASLRVPIGLLFDADPAGAVRVCLDDFQRGEWLDFRAPRVSLDRHPGAAAPDPQGSGADVHPT